MRSADLAKKLPGVKRRGEYYDTRCPAHPDSDPSLSFSDGDVAIRFLCRSGCTHEDIAVAMAALVRCDPQDFIFNRNGHRSEPIAVFTYTTHEGEGVYQECKFPDGTFKLRRPDPQHADRWIWNMQDTKKVLYNLPDLLDVKAPLYVEGAKDVETLRALGLVATTHVMGAKAFRTEYAAQLKQAMAPDGWVLVLRDEDAPGMALQHQVLTACHAVGLKVKAIILPGLVAGSGADITDWINAGHTKAELLEIIEATREWTPATNINIEQELFGTEDPFGGEPEPVEPALLPVPASPIVLLPEAFQPWVTDIAERVQCPADFVAIAAMVSIASVIGRQCGIRPKRFDDWLVVVNLWGQAIGPPGVMKTPALTQAMRPLRYLVAIADQEYQEKLKHIEFETVKIEAKRKVITDQIKKGIAEDQDVEHLAAKLAALEVPAPIRRRYETNDATIEKLGVMMNENPKGILNFEDELSGWYRTFDREGHQKDRAFWEKAWAGDQAESIDRIGRGELYIPACCGSILGGIQPGPLAHLLRDVFANGRTNDGMAQRFQLSVWPDITEWQDVQRWPDTPARRRVYDIFKRLSDLDGQALGVQEPADDDDKTLAYLRFTPEAQALFDDWYAALMRRLRTNTEEHPVLLNHLSKYPSLMASLALVIHLVDCTDRGTGGPVSETATLQAIGWCEFLEAHARRMYACVTAPGRAAMATLAQKIRTKALTRSFRYRDVKRKHWSGLTGKDASGRDEISEALDGLVGLHWLRREPVSPKPKGRPTVVYHVHPAITESWP